MQETETVIDQLNQIARIGNKYPSGQIVMIKLAHLAENNLSVKDRLDEELKLVGVESRTDAIRNTAEDIAETMQDINSNPSDIDYNYQNLNKQQKRFNDLVDNYHGVSSQWLAYDLSTKGFYHKLNHNTAMIILNNVIKDI